MPTTEIHEIHEIHAVLNEHIFECCNIRERFATVALTVLL